MATRGLCHAITRHSGVQAMPERAERRAGNLAVHRGEYLVCTVRLMSDRQQANRPLVSARGSAQRSRHHKLRWLMDAQNTQNRTAAP